MIIKNHFKGCYNHFNQEIFDYLRERGDESIVTSLNQFFQRRFEKKSLISIYPLKVKIEKKLTGYEISTLDHFTSMLLQGLYVKELYDNHRGDIIVKDGKSLYYWNKYGKLLYRTTGTIGNQVILEMTDRNRLYVFNRASDEYMKRVLELL